MDEERVSYEEAVEAIRNWIKAVYEFSDDDVETIYANGRPIDMVREQTRNALTTYDLEYGCRVRLEISRRQTMLLGCWQIAISLCKTHESGALTPITHWLIWSKRQEVFDTVRQKLRLSQLGMKRKDLGRIGWLLF